MKIYLLSQSKNNGYDTYDSMVVCANNKDDAKMVSLLDGDKEEKDYLESVWVTSPNDITCIEIGDANDEQVRGKICTSFNAG